MKNCIRSVAMILSFALVVPMAGCIATPEDSSNNISAVTIPITTTTTSEETTVPTETVETFETTEAEMTSADTDYIRLLPDVSPEMMSADHWIDVGYASGFNMDEVMMDESQIETFNSGNYLPFKVTDDEVLFYYNEIGETFEGDKLRQLLESNRDQIPEDPSNYYLNGQSTTASYWNGLKALDNLSAVPDTIEVRYGYTVRRATLRLFPTEDRVFESTNDRYFDYILFSECMPYLPVIILHESTDGNYYYAVFDSFAAWVKKDAIALCTDRSDWEARQNPSQVLTVTAREIRLGNDPYSPATSDLVLPMGTHMELVPATEAPESIGQRTTLGDYVVKVPTRGDDGYITDQFVQIPMSDDVTVGVLPLTPANILRQTFKLLGDRYGWGGDLQANDCSGIIREIYNCFGVRIPRVLQTTVTGVHKVDMSGMNEQEKLTSFSRLLPGSYIAMPGHMMVYLGTENGRPYVISAVGSLIPPAPSSGTQLHSNSVVLSSLYVRLRSLNTWLDSIKTAVTVVEE